MRTRILFLIVMMSITPLLTFANGKRITKIVLDAGHGGKDFGATGSFSHEKDITLAVVLKLGKIITDSLKDVQVIYTRTSDVYPSLVDRHEIANQSNADLFLSVHVNSTPYTHTRVFDGYRTVKRRHHKARREPVYRYVRHHVTSVSGVESYVLGLHRNSQKEDAIGEYSENVTDEQGLLNENDPQTAIIVAQYAQAFLSRSVSFATAIQQQFSYEGRNNLGVKQKGLEVLAGSAMPGVLVEIGYIDNPEEETYLNSERGQYEVAMALYRAIKVYKAESEK